MQKVENNDVLVEEMFKAGAQYGYSKTRRHPSVSRFIYTTKNKTDIIDLQKTSVMLAEANEFIKSLGAGNKVVLFVGTKPEAKEAVKAVAESLNMPYVTERWIGGTISNFSEIKKRIAELENYHKDTATGSLDKYTKKERVVMAKKMEKHAWILAGIVLLLIVNVYGVFFKHDALRLETVKVGGEQNMILANKLYSSTAYKDQQKTTLEQVLASIDQTATDTTTTPTTTTSTDTQAGASTIDLAKVKTIKAD